VGTDHVCVFRSHVCGFSESGHRPGEGLEGDGYVTALSEQVSSRLFGGELEGDVAGKLSEVRVVYVALDRPLGYPETGG